ncbi:VOC family protein [Halobacillus sp. K22]|uniref:VOC family protein n=1 Tax=Halobacillus sp. K22 TaxID=3457431 RepID=UPI003FCC4365
MARNLLRVGTVYLPVQQVDEAAEWYVDKLDAHVTYKDENKAIVNMANLSFFLIKAKEKETANFIDEAGEECFSLTFEVNGVEELEVLYNELAALGVQVGPFENRGHAGKNFIFYDADGNMFDVWSELSSVFKEKFDIG